MYLRKNTEDFSQLKIFPAYRILIETVNYFKFINYKIQLWKMLQAILFKKLSGFIKKYIL